MESKKKVVIIGAGPGGLAAAMRLVASGHQVTLFEKQQDIGGRTAALHLGPFTFDLGPTFLMMPEVLEELFEAVDRNLNDYVKLKELSPLYTLRFGDLSFSPSRDQEQTAQKIEALFPGESAGYRMFMKKEGRKFDKVRTLLQKPFTKLTDYLSSDVLRALPFLDATQTVYGRLASYFKDERLRWAFSFQAKYLGMSAWECPATFTILSYLEHRFGLFHPIGGVNQICAAMARVIEEYGGQIVTNAPVRQILVKDKRAIGVELESGERIDADDVVINADFGYAATSLFEDGLLKKYRPEKLSERRFSCSTYMLYLGLDRPVDLPHHTIFFAKDYKKNVEDLTRLGKLSEDASIYVHNPSVLDPTLAPEGQSALYILMPVPNLDAHIDWEHEEAHVRNQILDRLEREPELKGLRHAIIAEKRLTPLGWQEAHNVYKGATFNLSHDLGQMMILRPHNAFEEVRHCFLVGGGTHPGSGLPTIFESAKITANLLNQQYRVPSRRVGRLRKWKEARIPWTLP